MAVSRACIIFYTPSVLAKRRWLQPWPFTAGAAAPSSERSRRRCASVARAAWHDAGTYNAADGTGGANGTIRFDPEMSAAPNAGLSLAYKLLSKIEKAHPEVSWADLAQMCSATAIEVCTATPEVAACGVQRLAQMPDSA